MRTNFLRVELLLQVDDGLIDAVIFDAVAAKVSLSLAKMCVTRDEFDKLDALAEAGRQPVRVAFELERRARRRTRSFRSGEARSRRECRSSLFNARSRWLRLDRLQKVVDRVHFECLQRVLVVRSRKDDQRLLVRAPEGTRTRSCPASRCREITHRP